MADGKLLFHYCSTQTGFAILQNRSMRLSALSSANDTMEGRVLGRVFTQLLQGTKLPREVVDVASIIVDGYADSTEGFALCLSEKGDLLSQWRAYGKDGTGVAIGFSPDVLSKDFGEVNFGARFCELTKVEYGEDGLLSALSPLANSISDDFAEFGRFVSLRSGVTKEAALRLLAVREVDARVFTGTHPKSAELLDRLLKALAPLHFKIYQTKPDHFHEEREWRLLRYRHKAALPDIEYFADDRSVRPYIPCLIADPAKEAIQEVVLGPKHISNVNWVRAFLTSVGLPHVRVVCSKIGSYR